MSTSTDPSSWPAPPVPADEARRLAALLSCGVLDSPAESGFDDLATLAAEICGTPMATVSLVDESRQWFKSKLGLEVSETPRNVAFCAVAILSDEPLIVNDTHRDERFEEHPLVVGEPHLRFYAGIPLKLHTGERVGSFCVLDTQPHELTDVQLERLHMLARQAVNQLELRRAVARTETFEPQARKLQLELRRALDEAESASVAKTTFLRNISHEFRTPLTTVLGYAELLAETELDAEQTDFLRRLLANGKRLRAMIDDTLDVAELETGNIEFSYEAVDLRRLIFDVAYMFELDAREANLDLEILADPSANWEVLTDRRRVRQIIANLVCNAIKFTESGGVRIALERTVHNPPLIRVSVRDTGVGIQPDALDLLFQPFAQADGSLTRRREGAGIGLAIARRLADRLTGQVSATSTPGAGSTFVLDLPREAALTAAELDSLKSQRAHASGRLDDVRILLAEDSEDNQRLIAHLLQSAGATVDTAPDGRAAVTAASVAMREEHPYDLIIMDVQMPNMDGLEATRTIRALGWNGPITALSAHDTKDDQHRSIDAGCDWHATKPISKKQLVALCHSLTNRAA